MSGVQSALPKKDLAWLTRQLERRRRQRKKCLFRKSSDMCRRHVGPSFASIPRLSEEEARSVYGRSVVFVVDVLCSNPGCFFRDEDVWESVARRRRQLFRSCGSSACLTVNRCCLVELSAPVGHKRRRYVLDEHSVGPQPSSRQQQRASTRTSHSSK